MGMEDDFLLEDEDDEKTIEFIKNYLPQDMKEAFSDDEGYINIDQDEIVNYIVKESAKDGMGPFDPDAIFFVVQGEMEYGNQLGQVE